MTREFFKRHYNALYTMLISTSLLSNTRTEAFFSDSREVISFIAKAYGLNDSELEYCINAIEGASEVNLIADQLAVFSTRGGDEELSDSDILMDLKGEVLLLYNRFSKGDVPYVNPVWFDYNRYIPYKPEIRYYEINIASATGDIIITREAGLMKALGLGCDRDYTEAERRFKQCLYWGDNASAHLLAYLYKLLGNEDKARFFGEVADLCDKYLNSGITIVPEEIRANYSEEACTEFAYISSIKLDIVYPYKRNEIDFSFVEAFLSDELDFYQKMRFINNYEKKEWREVTNSSTRPVKLGF